MITFLLFVTAVGHLEGFSDEIERFHEERTVGNFNKMELVVLKQGKWFEKSVQKSLIKWLHYMEIQPVDDSTVEVCDGFPMNPKIREIAKFSFSSLIVIFEEKPQKLKLGWMIALKKIKNHM